MSSDVNKYLSFLCQIATEINELSLDIYNMGKQLSNTNYCPTEEDIRKSETKLHQGEKTSFNKILTRMKSFYPHMKVNEIFVNNIRELQEGKEQLKTFLDGMLSSCKAKEAELLFNLQSRSVVHNVLKSSLTSETKEPRRLQIESMQRIHLNSDVMTQMDNFTVDNMTEGKLHAVGKENASLLMEIERCYMSLCERRQKLKGSFFLYRHDVVKCKSGSDMTLLARCSFAEARRDRLKREVEELIKACDCERAVHASFPEEERQLCIEFMHIYHKRRLLIAEKAVTTDLARDRYAQESITATLRGGLLQGDIINT